MSAIAALDRVIERIEKARLGYGAKHIVRFVAVSKYASSQEIARLYGAGQRAFGENKAQDLARKSAELSDLPIEWHFIGAIQSNKINKLLDLRPALIHSIDSLKRAMEIESRLEKLNLDQRALLQVNAAREESKNGVAPEAAVDEYEAIAGKCRRLKMEGIMAIGAHTEGKRDLIRSFETARNIFDRISGAKILSMGMSGDFEEAIARGANLLRLGGVLFNGGKG